VLATAPLLVLAALAREAAAVVRALPGAARLAPAPEAPFVGALWCPPPGRVPVLVVRTGPGGAGLGAEGLARALRAVRPSGVVAVGFAAALDPALRAGDLVLAEPVVDPSGGGLWWPASLLADSAAAAGSAARLAIHVGPLLSLGKGARGAGAPLPPSHVRPLALDMESAAAARAAAEAGVPFVALRVVAARAGDPPSLGPWRFVGRDGRRVPVRTLRYLIGQPEALPAVAAAAWRTRRASVALTALSAAWLAAGTTPGPTPPRSAG
jgi:adenosylhomocysteine nucleosidase